MNREALNCEAARALIHDHAAGELPPALWPLLDGHLEGCSACRDELETLAEAGATLSRAAGSEADARAATDSLRPPYAATAPRRAWGPWVAAAGVVFAFGAGYFVRGDSPASNPPAITTSAETRNQESVRTAFVKASSSTPGVSTLGRGMLSIAR